MLFKQTDDSATIYQLRVTLEGVKPPVWRRFTIPSNITLGDLHEILQIVMGWRNISLHTFFIGKQEYNVRSNECVRACDNEKIVRNERLTRISSIGMRKGFRFVYIHNYNEQWKHVIEVERVLPIGDGSGLACIDGQNTCPPEGSGVPKCHVSDDCFLDEERTSGHEPDIRSINFRLLKFKTETK